MGQTGDLRFIMEFTKLVNLVQMQVTKIIGEESTGVVDALVYLYRLAPRSAIQNEESIRIRAAVLSAAQLCRIDTEYQKMVHVMDHIIYPNKNLWNIENSRQSMIDEILSQFPEDWTVWMEATIMQLP